MDALDELLSTDALDQVLKLPTATLDFVYFGEQIAWCSWLMRLQVIFNTASDEIFAAKNFKAFSAPARLKVIEKLCNAMDLTID